MTSESTETAADHTISRKGKLYLFTFASLYVAMLAMASDSLRPPYVSWKVELGFGVAGVSVLWFTYAVDKRI